MSKPVKKTNHTPGDYSPKQKPEILSVADRAKPAGQPVAATENLLTGFPEMGYGNPSAVCYIGSVMRVLEYLNDPIAEDELFALSGTGDRKSVV